MNRGGTVEASLEVEGVFRIKDRGVVITGPATAMFHAGDYITCGDVTTEVTGVEGWAMAAPTRSFPTPLGLLTRLDESAFAVGQVWIQSDRTDD